MLANSRREAERLLLWSRPALDATLRWFGDTQVTLFHACQVHGSEQTGGTAPTSEAWKAIATAQCDTCLTGMPIDAQTLQRLHRVIDRSSPETLLPDFVRHQEVDLVVAGTHGYGGLLKTLLGSTAQSLLHALECDVLVV